MSIVKIFIVIRATLLGLYCARHCVRHLFLFLSLTFLESCYTVAVSIHPSEIRESGKLVRELELVAYTFLSEITCAISFALDVLAQYSRKEHKEDRVTYSCNVHANFEITSRPSNSTGHMRWQNEIIIITSRLWHISLAIYRSDTLLSND